MRRKTVQRGRYVAWRSAGWRVLARLPNYQVFDEKRYFSEGDTPCVVDVVGIKVGITICEDIWHKEPQMRRDAWVPSC